MKKTFVIAEAGVNHNGSMKLARELVAAAARSGADAVKFQAFKANRLAAGSAAKAAYQRKATGEGTQAEMLRKLELRFEDFQELAALATRHGIEFMASAFDEESLEELLRLPIRRLKFGSGELTTAPLLRAASKSGLPIILSTGMASVDEVAEALACIAQTIHEPSIPPSRKAWRDRARDQSQFTELRETISLLHCTTEYPCPFDEVNLQAMATLRNRFGLEVGYSDHTPGIQVSVAAAALGATIIEKHLTLDTAMEGPDHRASLNPGDFRELVASIRAVDAALGSGVKVAQPSEEKNRQIARKSVVATRPITRGTPFSPANISTKRPATGLSAMDYYDLLGKVATRDYAEDEIIPGDELR